MEYITLENAVVHKLCSDFLDRNGIDLDKFNEQCSKRYDEKVVDDFKEQEAHDELWKLSNTKHILNFSRLEEALDKILDVHKPNYAYFKERCLLLEVEKYIKSSAVGVGVMTLEHNSARILGELASIDISKEYKDWMAMEYIPDTYFRDKLKGVKAEKPKPKPPECLQDELVKMTSKEIWFTLGGILILAAIVITAFV